jgi:hypothetical protein
VALSRSLSRSQISTRRGPLSRMFSARSEATGIDNWVSWSSRIAGRFAHAASKSVQAPQGNQAPPKLLQEVRLQLVSAREEPLPKMPVSVAVKRRQPVVVDVRP